MTGPYLILLGVFLLGLCLGGALGWLIREVFGEVDKWEAGWDPREASPLKAPVRPAQAPNPLPATSPAEIPVEASYGLPGGSEGIVTQYLPGAP